MRATIIPKTGGLQYSTIPAGFVAEMPRQFYILKRPVV